MKNFEEILSNLFDSWFDGKHKLLEFEQLFTENKEIEDLKEELLPDFFDNLNQFYWNYFFMTIARLLDSHKQNQNTNLTLFTLSEILKENDKNEWRIVFDKTEKLKKKYNDIIKYRRKNLAHFDFEYSLGQKVFNTSTHIDEVNYFFDKMIELINLTNTIMELKEKSPVIMRRARYKGGIELIEILRDYKKYSSQHCI